MFAIYFEDNMEPLGIYESKNVALIAAKLFSSAKSRAIIGIMNGTDGETTICFKCQEGHQTYDGGCCPPKMVPTSETTFSDTVL